MHSREVNMICGKHVDGRIVLMAKEYNLMPMIFFPQSTTWERAVITGEELSEFTQIQDSYLVSLLLTDAINFAELNNEFKINK